MLEFSPIIVGLVESITEFLPISSTAHLILAERFLSSNLMENSHFQIFIQLPPLICLILYYFKDISQIISQTLRGNFRGFIPFFSLINAFFATTILGFLLKYLIISMKIGPFIPVAMLISGLIFIRLSKKQEENSISELYKITPLIGFAIGCAQAISVIPGVSRLGITLIAGAILGLEKSNNIRFSFLLGILTLSAASLYTFLKIGTNISLENSEITALITCALCSLVFFAPLLNLLKRTKFKIWGIYRIAFSLMFWFEF